MPLQCHARSFDLPFYAPMPTMTWQLFLLLTVAVALSFCVSPSGAQGRYLYHEFNLRFFDGAPNGVQKRILGVNDQFPGPTIHATIGDFLEVRVINSIQTGENTSIHWHGLEQYQTPFEDGPEYVTQCPILAGQSQSYKFQLVQAGTYWWHSHHAWQYSEGAWGALIIRNNPETHAMEYDEREGHEITIALSDWFNPSVARVTEWYLSPESRGNPPVPDSVLINGRGLYPCTAARAQGYQCDPSTQGYPIFNVTRGATYRVRVVNTAAAISTQFSIDGHKLRVIEVDGVDTKLGQPVDVATLAPAQRYSFVVTMDDPNVDQFWIRVYAPGVPDRTPNINPDPKSFDPNAYAVLRYIEPDFGTFGIESFVPQEVGSSGPAYQGRPATHDELRPLPTPSTRVLPARPSYSLVNPLELVTSNNLPKTQAPSAPVHLNEQDCGPEDMLAPANYTQQITLDVFNTKKRDGSYEWSFNKRPYKMSRNGEPALFQVLKGQRVETGFNPIYTQFGKGKVVQIVINNPGMVPHPFHLHGHTTWVVGKGAAGAGYYIPAVHEAGLRLDGVRRDTVTVDRNSYIVLRYYADNPGTWLLHCHINWHLHAGLGMIMVEGPSAMRAFTRLPMEWVDVCKKSGLRLS